MMSAARRARSVIVIVGTTGAGKTKLSIEVAKRFNGEVVSADAMQMYRGLDVATAKITDEEMDGVPHHLLSFLEPWEELTVRDYTARAQPIIDGILERGKLPVIVGGTLYYIQGLLWDAVLLGDAGEGACDYREQPVPVDKEERNALSARLHAELTRVDPTTAARLHPHNLRKIQNALGVFQRTGEPMSAALARQRKRPRGGVAADAESGVAEEGGSGAYGAGVLTRHGHVRYDAHALWVSCAAEELDRRLDKRVEDMVRAGLLPECRRLYGCIRAHADGGSSPAGLVARSRQFTRGVFQAIGFKEFFPYIQAEEAALGWDAYPGALDEAARDPSAPLASPQPLPELVGAFGSCVERLKTSTHQYAREQLKWLRNRFVGHGVPVTVLDSSSAAEWPARVTPLAERAVEDMLTGRVAPVPGADAVPVVAAWKAQIEAERARVELRAAKRRRQKEEQRGRALAHFQQWKQRGGAEEQEDATQREGCAE